MTTSAVALLGRKDEPTDAVEVYCHCLSEALQSHGIRMDVRRVPWNIHGWPDSLRALELMATQWRGTWVFVQYTALAWSSRGFPNKVLQAFRILKKAGARIGVVFHDVDAFAGGGLASTIRRFVQLRLMRRMVRESELAIFTISLDKIAWLDPKPPHAAFVAVGPTLRMDKPGFSSVAHNPPTIGVFSITGGTHGEWETITIVSAARFAADKLGAVRLSVFGRAAELRETALRDALRGSPVQLSVEGIVSDQEVVERLCASDLLLFVRGGISSRRSSAIAGIACGLPVIAFANSETAPPVTGAGVVVVPQDKPDDINAAVLHVLSNSGYRQELAARSRAAYRDHFSWPAIAARFASILQAK